MKRGLLVVAFLCLSTQFISAQDTLITLLNEKIVCIVDEVDEEVVQFQYLGQDDNSMHGFPLSKLKRIVYADGFIQEINNPQEVSYLKDTLAISDEIVYRNGVRLSKNEVKAILFKDPYAYDMYRRGKSKSNIGGVLLYTGSFFVGAELALVISQGEINPIGLLVWGGILAGGFALTFKGKRMMHEAIRHYNSQYIKQEGFRVDLGGAQNGIGVTITF